MKRIFTLMSITATLGGTTLVKFKGKDTGWGFNVLEVRLTDAGRVISIGLDSRTLHSRDQRKGGGKPIRLAPAKFKACRDMSCAVVAAVVLSGSSPPTGLSWELDL